MINVKIAVKIEKAKELILIYLDWIVLGNSSYSSKLCWWSHFVFSHSSGHFLFPSLPLVWTSDQAITTRMYWNRIFLLLSKHSFCWLDISESLKSCLNNFKWWRLLNDHDDVEGEEGATILVQLSLLLHRPPWASLMADAWFPTPFSTAESSTTPPPQFYCTLCQL